MATVTQSYDNKYLVTLTDHENHRLTSWLSNPDHPVPQTLASLITLIFHSTNNLQNKLNQLSSET